MFLLIESVFEYMLYLSSKVSVLLDTLVCGCQLFLPGSLICSRSNLSLGNKSYFVGKPNDAKALLEKKSLLLFEVVTSVEVD